MLTFLEETLKDLSQKYPDLSSCTIVLPSKRAGGFLKNYLQKKASSISFAPIIISIEEFIETLSNLSITTPDQLLIKSYQAYLETPGIITKESFADFTTWASALLNDFSEIDRYMVDPNAFFDYLASIKTLEKWGASESQTPLIKDYLSFWNHLQDFYFRLNNLLQNEQLGYQGMVYRKAAEDIEHYAISHGNKPHVFIGFNALNAAEQQIIQGLLETEATSVYWDTDAHYYNDQEHSASIFIRTYLNQWKYYNTHPKPTFPSNYRLPKAMEIISAPNTISQVKHLGHILSAYAPEKLENTAVVLADEALLLPVLYALPPNIRKANVTMGISLGALDATTFFELLIKLHLKSSKSYYYKDIVALLSHPLLQEFVEENQRTIAKISEENRTYITPEKLFSIAHEHSKKLYLNLFGNWNNDSFVAIKACRAILVSIAQNKPKSVEKLVLKKLIDVFDRIKELAKAHNYLNEIVTLFSLFKQLANSDSLDFEGDAYNGLQIMGVLETRVLDFQNIIMLSVNEGVLPTGKSSASFITSDLKKQFGLPPYTEKDAVYTYHFYRMLQRAEEVTMLYNSYSSGLTTGEKSRYLLQLEIENLASHELRMSTIDAPVNLQKSELKTIQKTSAIQQLLTGIAGSYFSPSSLTSYVRNPMDFYYQKILKINEAQVVEETVAHNTLGTIVHHALENLYRPLEGIELSESALIELKEKVTPEVSAQFEAHFKAGSFNTGKNLIIFEVAKRYVNNLIDLDRSEVKKGHKITILKLEAKLKTKLQIPELSFPVFLGGTVDRIDRYNDTVRVIDYKTGSVQQNELEIIDWTSIITDYKYSKAFQVLAYALLIKRELAYASVEAGVISFKNLGGGFLKFSKKESSRGAKQTDISEETLRNFESQLHTLILEICNLDTPFLQKEV